MPLIFKFQLMEHYYFIVTNTHKEGPFKLEQLKEMKLPKNTEVWRSDYSDWKIISEVEELVEYIFTEPPKTTKEIKIEVSKNKLLDDIKSTTILYIIFSLLIAIFSSLMAYSSWQFYQKSITEKHNPTE